MHIPRLVNTLPVCQYILKFRDTYIALFYTFRLQQTKSQIKPNVTLNSKKAIPILTICECYKNVIISVQKMTQIFPSIIDIRYDIT